MTAVDSSALCLQQGDTHRSASKPDQAVFHCLCSGQHIIILFGCQPRHMFVMLSGCFISTVASAVFSSTAERVIAIERSHCTKRAIRCRNNKYENCFLSYAYSGMRDSEDHMVLPTGLVRMILRSYCIWYRSARCCADSNNQV